VTKGNRIARGLFSADVVRSAYRILPGSTKMTPKCKEIMKRTKMDDELRPEYDLESLRVRSLGPGRKSFGSMVRLEPDVAEAFPDAESVNEALRFLIRITKENKPALHAPKRDT
jgi:hypothetical protein